MYLGKSNKNRFRIHTTIGLDGWTNKPNAKGRYSKTTKFYHGYRSIRNLKRNNRQLKKILHEPIAPYLADTYNVVIHLVHGVVLGALFYIISIQENFDILIAFKVFVVFLLVCLIWHSYLVHNLYGAWRIGIFDTIIPLVFALSQCLLVLAIPKNIFIFSLFFTIIPIIGFFAYLNAFIRLGEPEAIELYKEHFKDQGTEFAESLYLELRSFDKGAMVSMVIIAAVLGVITALSYYIQALSEEIKTYIVIIIILLLFILLSRYDLKYKLNKSEKLKKYGYRW